METIFIVLRYICDVIGVMVFGVMLDCWQEGDVENFKYQPSDILIFQLAMARDKMLSI